MKAKHWWLLALVSLTGTLLCLQAGLYLIGQIFPGDTHGAFRPRGATFFLQAKQFNGISVSDQRDIDVYIGDVWIASFPSNKKKEIENFFSYDVSNKELRILVGASRDYNKALSNVRIDARQSELGSISLKFQ